ncbi:MAG: phospholipid-binding protein MlaC [Aliivibrio sp.]|uniref:phospholipid-binding protein MlaC n=1 Tax=Aliivibrio sp. TaxID=1872443 RepID=UPI001A40D6E2|nr:phospholipid-binding protein MlaC [Aliivibrio sp.]
MNKIVVFSSLIITLFCVSISATEIDKSKPYEMMETIAENTFDRLKAEQLDIQKNPELYKVIVSEELMPYINVKYAAYLLLGPELKKTSVEDRKEFVTAFRAYLISSYAQVLTQYSDQQIKFNPHKAVSSKKSILTVRLEIVDSDRPNIKIAFKLRKNKKNGQWQGYDIIAEGVSLLSSKQAEWKSRIRTQGVHSISHELHQLAKAPIRLEEKNQ